MADTKSRPNILRSQIKFRRNSKIKRIWHTFGCVQKNMNANFIDWTQVECIVMSNIISKPPVSPPPPPTHPTPPLFTSFQRSKRCRLLNHPIRQFIHKSFTNKSTIYIFCSSTNLFSQIKNKRFQCAGPKKEKKKTNDRMAFLWYTHRLLCGKIHPIKYY